MNLWSESSPPDHWDHTIMEGIELMEASLLLERSIASLSIYFIEPHTENTFDNHESEPVD
jgi:hypothetical protein